MDRYGKWFGWIFALVFVSVLLFNVVLLFLPVEKSIEIRCKMGDSVACLSLKDNYGKY